MLAQGAEMSSSAETTSLLTAAHVAGVARVGNCRSAPRHATFFARLGLLRVREVGTSSGASSSAQARVKHPNLVSSCVEGE